jgi:hypothetical protein
MKRRLVLLLIILAIPVIVYGVALALQSKYEGEWQAMLAKEYPLAKEGPDESVERLPPLSLRLAGC